MTPVVRTVAGALVLAVPAVALAAALVGKRPNRVAAAVRLGLVAALPGVATLVWLQGHATSSLVVRITVLLAALVPGYGLAGWLAARSASPRRPVVPTAWHDDVVEGDVEYGPARLPAGNHDAR